MVIMLGLSTPSLAVEESSYIDLAVQIVCPSSRGAGFFLEEKIVVTAKHVIENCLAPQIINNKGIRTRTVSIDFSNNKDLAYIEVAEAIVPVVIIAKTPSINSEVFTVGSPIDGLLLSKGTLREVFRDLTEEWLVLDIPADQGSSGGPVFSSGGLIGLVISKDKRNGDIYAYRALDMKDDYDYVSQDDESRQNNVRPFGNSGTELLLPIFISGAVTFLLGLGIGVTISKRRVRTNKPRIRIEV
jgi:hypothetical protein